MQSIFQKNYLKLFFIVITTTIFSLSATAFAKGDVNVDNSGVAIKGYDTVAYFVDGKPRKGTGKFTHKHAGNTWQFVSQLNLDTFAKNPSAYTPQFGGFCAYAASKNSIAPVDPTAWKIQDNKLYLNYNKSINKKWLKNLDANIVKGNANWPALSLKVETR